MSNFYTVKDLNALLNASTDEFVFIEIVKMLYRDGKLTKQFLQEYNLHLKEKPLMEKENILIYLMNYSTTHLNKEEDYRVINTIRLLVFDNIDNFISNLDGINQLPLFVTSLLTKTTDLYVSFSITATLDPFLKDENLPYFHFPEINDYLSKNIFELINICLKKISNIDCNDFFYKTFNPFFILRCWKHWENDKTKVEIFIGNFLINKKMCYIF
jgi:hypothetical protein